MRTTQYLVVVLSDDSWMVEKDLNKSEAVCSFTGLPDNARVLTRERFDGVYDRHYRATGNHALAVSLTANELFEEKSE